MPKPQLANGLGRLKQLSGHEPPPMATLPVAAEPATPVAKKRPGLVQIAAHFDLSVRQQLEMIGVLQNRTIQDMLGEALNDLFVKYNQSAIAPVYGEGSRSKPRQR